MIGPVTQVLPKAKAGIHALTISRSLASKSSSRTLRTMKAIEILSDSKPLIDKPIVQTVITEGQNIANATWKSYLFAKFGTKTGMTLPEIMQYKEAVRLYSKAFSSQLSFYLKSLGKKK